ncbi:MAG: adenosylcobinamide-GDP ribazoletransferase [Pseudomonadota bacterium]|nr:adenosylcobinamide-GDP ribazoletransferase [Pseudomonadota bacterium]
MNGLRIGVTFLTRLPLRSEAPAPGDWARAVRWFPLGGAIVASVGMAALLFGSFALTPLVGAVAAVAAMVWVTGALHVDGFSDCLDGMHCHGDAERRLKVMHDPAAGAVGAAGTTLMLLAKVALLGACVETGTGAAALWAACVCARAFLPLEIALGTPATPGKGLFARLAAEVRPRDAAWAGLLAAVLVAPAVVLVPSVVVGLGVGLVGAGAATLAWQASWRERIGGINGDVLGAAVELRELVLLAAMGMRWLA